MAAACALQFTSQPRSEPTTLRVFPGANGTFTLYDDDGQSLAYRDGSDLNTVWIRFRWDDSARRLFIEPDPRMKKFPGPTRPFTVQIVGQKPSAEPSQFNGKPLSFSL